jgi:hypothetical protein
MNIIWLLSYVESRLNVYIYKYILIDTYMYIYKHEWKYGNVWEISGRGKERDGVMGMDNIKVRYVYIWKSHNKNH